MAVTVNNATEGTVARVSVLEERVKALAEIANERDRRYEDRFRLGDEKIVIALNSSEKAVSKAEGANEKRFDSVNEFRGSLKDQAAGFVSRPEFDAKNKASDERFDEMKKDVAGLRESRSAAEASARTYVLVGGLIIAAVQIALHFWK